MDVVSSMQTAQIETDQTNTPVYSFVPRLIGLVRRNVLLVLVVILPTLVSAIYYGFIASDVYISESKFVVRSPQKQSVSGLGALLQSSGFSRSQDDVYTVHDYMLSRDAVRTLEGSLSLRKIYGNSQVDVFGRFGGFWSDNSFEELYRYYGKKVHLDLDSLSSITTLRVRAYTPQDAWHINEQLIEMSEALVNKINERGQGDLVRFAQNEVDAAKKDMRSAASALSTYRNKQGIFDTDKQSALQLQQVSKLQDQLVATVSQLNQIKVLAPQNPQLPVLENQRATLQNEIENQVSGVAGAQGSLSSQSAEYQSLQLNNTFAEKELGVALASLEQAKNDAHRKHFYLERIVQPNKPDYALEPTRFRNVLAIFVLCLVIWSVLSMLFAGIREHQD